MISLNNREKKYIFYEHEQQKYIKKNKENKYIFDEQQKYIQKTRRTNIFSMNNKNIFRKQGEQKYFC